MKYQVGDRVLILHSGEEGEVIDIINDKMMLVDVNGVKFPVYMDQVDFPYFKRFTEKKAPETKKEKKYIDDVRKEKSSEGKVADGMWLTFLPVMVTDVHGDEIVTDLKLHLINRTNDAFNFKYHQTFFGRQEFDLKSEINPFENFYLHDVPFEDLNDNPVFEFEFSLLQPDKAKEEYYFTSVRLKPKQLFDKIAGIRKKNEATFSYRLFEKYPDKKIADKIEIDLSLKKSNVYDAAETRHHLEPARTVVDLHIEKLTDSWRGLNNFEILTLQLRTFEKYYDLAIAHLQPSLIVIHGMGEGKLRDEIHEILRQKKEVKTFVNQYHPLYGFGATEIFFEY